MGKSHKNEKKSKKKHKHKERKEKKKSKKLKKDAKNTSDLQNRTKPVDDIKPEQESDRDFAIPLELMNSKSHAPETQEEYQKRQSRIRREVDPSTGRQRLIKGDGEVLEEIVSKDRHKAINKEATRCDGVYFEDNTLCKFDE